MYSQFCYHIQHDEQKRRATMHINGKPGELVKVDWAERIGINAYTAVNAILTSKGVEQQNTKYVRLPDLLIDLEIGRTEGSYRRSMAKYANSLVLILCQSSRRRNH